MKQVNLVRTKADIYTFFLGFLLVPILEALVFDKLRLSGVLPLLWQGETISHLLHFQANKCGNN